MVKGAAQKILVNFVQDGGFNAVPKKGLPAVALQEKGYTMIPVALFLKHCAKAKKVSVEEIYTVLGCSVATVPPDYGGGEGPEPVECFVMPKISTLMTRLLAKSYITLSPLNLIERGGRTHVPIMKWDE